MTKDRTILHVVTTRHLCQACSIVEEVVRQMMAEATRDLAVDVQWTVYETMEEAFGHPNLELPSFPAIFLGDEQLTAGSIPSKEEIETWIQ